LTGRRAAQGPGLPGGSPEAGTERRL